MVAQNLKKQTSQPFFHATITKNLEHNYIVLFFVAFFHSQCLFANSRRARAAQGFLHSSAALSRHTQGFKGPIVHTLEIPLQGNSQGTKGLGHGSMICMVVEPLSGYNQRAPPQYQVPEILGVSGARSCQTTAPVSSVGATQADQLG